MDLTTKIISDSRMPKNIRKLRILTKSNEYEQAGVYLEKEDGNREDKDFRVKIENTFFLPFLNYFKITGKLKNVKNINTDVFGCKIGGKDYICKKEGNYFNSLIMHTSRDPFFISNSGIADFKEKINWSNKQSRKIMKDAGAKLTEFYIGAFYNKDMGYFLGYIEFKGVTFSEFRTNGKADYESNIFIITGGIRKKESSHGKLSIPVINKHSNLEFADITKKCKELVRNNVERIKEEYANINRAEVNSRQQGLPVGLEEGTIINGVALPQPKIKAIQQSSDIEIIATKKVLEINTQTFSNCYNAIHLGHKGKKFTIADIKKKYEVSLEVEEALNIVPKKPVLKIHDKNGIKTAKFVKAHMELHQDGIDPSIIYEITEEVKKAIDDPNFEKPADLPF